MIYLIYKSWVNTSSNHAGMKYMCQKLEDLYPEKYKSVEILIEKDKIHSGNLVSRAVNLFCRPIRKILKTKRLRKFGRSLRLNDSDIVLLVEYMDTRVGYIEIVKAIRNRNVNVFGISHLVPSELDSLFDDRSLESWVNEVDGIVTLGRSLTNYYIARGVDERKMHTTFHYVDSYYLADNIDAFSSFKVLVQGNQQRDVGTLAEIIRLTPEIHYVVCQGLSDLSKQFRFQNVELKPYMEENELRKLMAECAVSLNVMKDTIGSNVIVTSIGMGQAMICSDVGSIHDYCDESNCFFCSSANQFAEAVVRLSNDPDLLYLKRSNSLIISRRFTIENFEKSLNSILTE